MWDGWLEIEGLSGMRSWAHLLGTLCPPTGSATLPKLRMLYIENSELPAGAMQGCPPLPALTQLRLERCTGEAAGGGAAANAAAAAAAAGPGPSGTPVSAAAAGAVLCSAPRVDTLQLAECFQGQLPVELASMREVTKLDLSCNGLTDLPAGAWLAGEVTREWVLTARCIGGSCTAPCQCDAVLLQHGCTCECDAEVRCSRCAETAPLIAVCPLCRTAQPVIRPADHVASRKPVRHPSVCFVCCHQPNSSGAQQQLVRDCMLLVICCKGGAGIAPARHGSCPCIGSPAVQAAAAPVLAGRMPPTASQVAAVNCTSSAPSAWDLPMLQAAGA